MDDMRGRSGRDAKASVLAAAHTKSFAQSLQSALTAPSGLSQTEMVDAIRALEELSCVVSAAQAALTVEVDAAERARQADAGVPEARQGHGVAHLVAFARRESPYAGQRHLGLAKIALTELPHTWAAWRAGAISEWKATVIARETACLSLPQRRLIDQFIAADRARLEQMSAREIVGAIVKHSAQIDPAAVAERRRYAETQRAVSLRPAPDSMTWLTALLPVAAGVSVYAALTQAAGTAQAEGDPRSRGQVMADSLVERVTGHPADSIPVTVNLVMSDRALLNHDHREPAHLFGHGVIPGDLALDLVKNSARRNTAWLRRLYTAPKPGNLVAMESSARLFPKPLARFIALRDQTCRTPWCDAPIRHIDHVVGHHEGGPTSAANGQGLCESCNHAKQAPGWRARPGPDNEVVTQMPTGHQVSSRPPPRVRIAADFPSMDLGWIA